MNTKNCFVFRQIQKPIYRFSKNRYIGFDNPKPIYRFSSVLDPMAKPISETSGVVIGRVCWEWNSGDIHAARCVGYHACIMQISAEIVEFSVKLLKFGKLLNFRWFGALRNC